MLIFADILSSTILFAVPLLLVALGGMFSERSGIIYLSAFALLVQGGIARLLSRKHERAAGKEED